MSNVQDNQIKTGGLKQINSDFPTGGMSDLKTMGLQTLNHKQCNSFGSSTSNIFGMA